jgi:chromosome segregation ATPase
MVTQGARSDPGEGSSGIAPPVITLEDTIAPLVEKIIAREEKDQKIKENKASLAENHYSPNHKSEDEKSEDEQISHDGDTSVTLDSNDTSNSHNISQAQSKPSASSTPAKASSMELSLDTSSIKSRMKSAKGRLGQLGKRLSNLAENLKNERTKKTRSMSRISEEDQDESIVESKCPDAYRGHTSRPRAKGARKTTLCHIAQCLARGPDLVEDEADNPTLLFYDTMTVREALTACTLAAGTRFDMTRQARP